ncbi:AraC family transcriptional regulator [Pseudomonadota bacterium]
MLFNIKSLAILVCLFSAAVVSSAHAEENTPSELQGLEEQVENLKKEVLALNRDLFILEEELLFPATTQTTVFLSVDTGVYFKLDSIELKLNGKTVSHYLYTERELSALARGGVQRLHTDNLRKGQHELVAVFIGKGPNGRDYRRGASLEFEKGFDPKFIELKITDSSAKQQPEFAINEWE